MRALAELGTYGWMRLAADLDSVASRATVIVTSFLGQEVARAIAEKHDLAQVAVHYFPMRPARSVSLLEEPVIAGAVTNRLVWGSVSAAWRVLTRGGEDRMRASLGLGPSRGPLAARMAAAAGLEVQAVDPLLFPELSAEWGVRLPLVGFVDVDRDTLDAISGEDPSLDAWLDAGPAPIHWGFGSMPVGDPRVTLELVRRVSLELGVRSLVCAGWSDFAPEGDEQIRVVRSVNHRAVFPRCVLAVHHGGAGTTAASLRAGTPTLVAWFGADQKLWGGRLADLGVGSVLRFADLDCDRATTALRALMAPSVRVRAAEVKGRLIDPVAATAALADLVERAEARDRWRAGREGVRPAAPELASVAGADR
ncbi:MAG TPA: glycosyltransferase [Solirubrobacteraceae bacterium]|nr:glycosyltransferase [Solirubrobacteraceae bacterium]